MIISTFVVVIIVLSILSAMLITYILYDHFNSRRQRLLRKAKDDSKKIILQAVADSKVQAQAIIVNQELEYKSQQQLWLKQNEDLQLRDEMLNNREDSLLEREQKIKLRMNELEFERTKYERKLQDLIDVQANISNMSIDEVKKNLFDYVKQKYYREFNVAVKKIKDETNLKAKEVATNIITTAMQRYKTDIIAEKTVSYVKLDDDSLKGRIIGKDGRNIRTFEQFGGVDIIIDDTPNLITISSFNSIRREIATLALKTLIDDGRINPVRIEEELNHQRAVLENAIFETGKDVVEELGIVDMDISLVKLIGKLKFRTSYGQPVLQHSIEVAKIAESIALELNLDSNIALRAGLLHDIGKASDFELDKNHVEIGVDVATKAGESPIVVNAIAAHHEDVPKESIYAEIVVIADAISAARPGARNNDAQSFLVRMDEIERLVREINGVKDVYVLQSGRQVRVIVDPLTLNDEDIDAMPENIEEKIRRNVVVPGDINITIIREIRKTYLSKNKASR